MSETTAQIMPGVPAAARLLGLAGLIPFAGLSLAVMLGWHPLAGPALIGYGAVILSFMGGCRWGLAAAGMGQGPALLPLGVSVFPALFAWVIGLLPAAVALPALAAGFLALLWADLILTRQNGAPVWWPALRWPLSLGAATCLMFAAVFSGL